LGIEAEAKRGGGKGNRRHCKRIYWGLEKGGRRTSSPREDVIHFASAKGGEKRKDHIEHTKRKGAIVAPMRIPYSEGGRERRHILYGGGPWGGEKRVHSPDGGSGAIY